MTHASFIVRGHILHTPEGVLETIEDGALVIDNSGRVMAKGGFLELQKSFSILSVKDFSGRFIMPSFFDTHVHFPQLDMIGSCAEELLLWLDNYTFPAETAFRGRSGFVETAAKNFVRELSSNGTGCAVVYSSSCGEATDLLFEVFEASGLRAIIGKVSMDRHCPEEIAVPLEKDRRWTESLIQRWHQKGDRLHYALTPRFAPSCTDELMEAISQIYASDPSLYLQTHYAENEKEIAWVKDLFPASGNYLDVYDQRGMLREKTILAHAIHVSPEEQRVLLEKRVNISHCPSSNLFLGSGLFRGRDFLAEKQHVSLGSDVGAGTSFSLWQTMNEAYKVAQIRQERISPTQLFSLATDAAARSLGFLDQGCLNPGFAADFQVVDPSARPILERRLGTATHAEEKIAALIHFADDRCLQSLHINGREVLKN